MGTNSNKTYSTLEFHIRLNRGQDTGKYIKIFYFSFVHKERFTITTLVDLLPHSTYFKWATKAILSRPSHNAILKSLLTTAGGMIYISKLNEPSQC